MTDTMTLCPFDLLRVLWLGPDEGDGGLGGATQIELLVVGAAL